MRVSVEEMLNTDGPTRSTNTKAEYFSLVNDGDSAIVRFLHKDINDFEVLDVHTIQLAGFNRKINCLRQADGGKDDCPICQINMFDEEKGSYTYPLQRKFYIHMLKYDNPQTAKEVIWERSKEYIKKLNEFEQNYGPLCDRLYKIVRHGAKGSTDTTYDILPLDKDRFVPENYAFDESQLNYKKALGSTVLNYSSEDIIEYLNTGNFPNFKKKAEVSARPEPTAQTNNERTITVESVSTNNSETTVKAYNPDNTRVENPTSYSNSDTSFSFDGPRRRV